MFAINLKLRSLYTKIFIRPFCKHDKGVAKYMTGMTGQGYVEHFDRCKRCHKVVKYRKEIISSP